MIAGIHGPDYHWGSTGAVQYAAVDRTHCSYCAARYGQARPITRIVTKGPRNASRRQLQPGEARSSAAKRLEWRFRDHQCRVVEKDSPLDGLLQRGILANAEFEFESEAHE